MPANDLRALCIAPIVLLIGMFAVRYIRRATWLSPEWFRKLAHLGLGCMAAALPWCVETNTTVWLLAGLFALAFAYARSSNSLTGPIFQDVNRKSFGELAWALAIALTFHLRPNDGAYVAAIAILSISDPAAALIGQRYGKHPYTTRFGQRKSWEGTLACFAATLIILIAGNILGAWKLSSLSLLACATSVSAVEAIIGFGLDNLAIPLTVLAIFCLTAT